MLNKHPVRSRGSAFRLHHGGHQIVVPVAGDLEVGGGTLFEGFDQVVVHIGVDARLLEGVVGRAGSTTRDEPGFLVELRRVGEFAGCPDLVAMAAD